MIQIISTRSESGSLSRWLSSYWIRDLDIPGEEVSKLNVCCRSLLLRKDVDDDEDSMCSNEDVVELSRQMQTKNSLNMFQFIHIKNPFL